MVLVKHLIYARLSAVFYIVYCFTKVKSKAINNKIIMIKDEIKKSFLHIISSLLPYLVGGKHSTVKFPYKNYTI